MSSASSIDATVRRLLGATTPAERGYGMPAEWAPQAHVWVEPPHNRETWPGKAREGDRTFDLACQQHAAWVEAMQREGVVVRTVSGDAAHTTDDSWCRDFAPIFLRHREDGYLLAMDFCFDSWGGKYEGERNRDDAAAAVIAEAADTERQRVDWVLEGGAIDADGEGALLVGETCLLDTKRNPGVDPALATALLEHALGVEKVIALPGGIAGDDTDGHVDDTARFAPGGVVLVVVAADGHPDHLATHRNLQVLRESRNAQGRRLDVVALPAPEPVMHLFPADRWSAGGLEMLPASYANFLVTDPAVFVPTFGQRADDEACRVIESAFAGRNVVSVRAEHLVVGLGSLHCLSMQQPARPDPV